VPVKLWQLQAAMLAGAAVFVSAAAAFAERFG
jgi:hypothetical protein